MRHICAEKKKRGLKGQFTEKWIECNHLLTVILFQTCMANSLLQNTDSLKNVATVFVHTLKVNRVLKQRCIPLTFIDIFCTIYFLFHRANKCKFFLFFYLFWFSFFCTLLWHLAPILFVDNYQIKHRILHWSTASAL